MLLLQRDFKHADPNSMQIPMVCCLVAVTGSGEVSLVANVNLGMLLVTLGRQMALYPERSFPVPESLETSRKQCHFGTTKVLWSRSQKMMAWMVVARIAPSHSHALSSPFWLDIRSYTSICNLIFVQGKQCFPWTEAVSR